MIFEKIQLNIDIEKLRRHFEAIVRAYQPVFNRQFYGDKKKNQADGAGFQKAAETVRVVNNQLVYDQKISMALGLKPIPEHRFPTQICAGYLAEVVRKIHRLGLHPRLGRLACLRAGGESSLHADAPTHQYMVRLHVPIITNSGAVFVSEGEEKHAPADGSGYLVRVNRLHQIFNRSTFDRYHLVFDVWDTKHVSEHHRFFGNPHFVKKDAFMLNARLAVKSFL